MKTGLKTGLFLVIVMGWIGLDQWTKSLFAGVQSGAFLGNVLGGLVDFRLVHNTGAAWGIFAGNTVALGLFSLIAIAVLIGYFLFSIKSISLVQTIGIALIIAGGIGNVIDRFVQGYVIDFIAVTFIDFPVFNVADIGVTCGIALYFFGLLLQWRAVETD